MKNIYLQICSIIKNRGKEAKNRLETKKAQKLYMTAILLTWIFCLAGKPVMAIEPSTLPSGAEVVSGSADITTSGSTMTVNQHTDRMIANWDTFNIGQDATVTFDQLGSSSVSLNRIFDQNPSRIFGNLNANGQVFLLNPSGIYFGPTAQVDVGGLVASSLNLSDSNFLDNNYSFDNAGSTGNITNDGTIRTSDYGYVAFISPQIINNGNVSATQGMVAFAAGDKVRLDFTGDHLVNYIVDQGAVDAQVENRGLIKSDGGAVILTAKAADALTRSVVNNTGVIEAGGMSVNGGRIILDAGEAATETGQIIQSGSLNADGNIHGGQIELKSGYSVMNTGSLSAMGDTGGEISVNAKNIIEQGDLNAEGTQHGGSIVLNASNSLEQTAASALSVDSTNGNAGSIRAESDRNAFLSGSFSASGDKGGEIAITAPRLVLAGTQAQADGETGGGRVRIGGGWQGKDADLVNANKTTVSAATLTANAVENGNGGTVVVWSEQETMLGAHIEAKGGAAGGNGGNVEVSSHGRLGFGGTVDANAPEGTSGNLLLDPRDIEIIDSVSGISIISLADPSPQANDQHGSGKFAVELTNNGEGTDRIVVTSPYDDDAAVDAGAVRLYRMSDGTLLATLTGSSVNDRVGSGYFNFTPNVVTLANGNYVVSSPNWDNGDFADAGAVTWGNGTTGISGVVNSANSLVGSNAYDFVGIVVTALTNGNYIVNSPYWASGGVITASKGAVTWGDGANGINGPITLANSLVGSTPGDQVGSNGVTVLTNGNYIVDSPSWGSGGVDNAGKGAVTWVNGINGNTFDEQGVISSANSLVGSTAGDKAGSGNITELTNGNYVVSSPDWGSGGVDDAGKGAATWGDGTTGISGEISSANSLVGSMAYDRVSIDFGVRELTNGNYVVCSPWWASGGVGTSTGKGAVTWGNGTTGISGVVSSANSLVGSTSGDRVGFYLHVLTNGNYVAPSSLWDKPAEPGVDAVIDVGAVTWGDGTNGTTKGVVSSANSLVGSTPGDYVGQYGITELSNGNYVVPSASWGGSVGAVTWGNGATGISGEISSANSLVGSTAGDNTGSGYITALTNGNYVVSSTLWDNGGITDAGAVTWGNGTTGISGEISSANSLVGSTASDQVGSGGITALTNGNYVVRSNLWDNGDTMDVGAVTWGNGAAGINGPVTLANSLVGSTASDQVGNNGVTALTNGNYVVSSTLWDNGGITDAGAVTWGNGAAGINGPVTLANSLVGSTASDQVGSGGIMALTNGNYVVSSTLWDNGGTTDAGAVTWGNGAAGINGPVTLANSLVGSTASDQVGNNGVTVLTNGNYVVSSTLWDNSDATNAGAVTWGNGGTGINGAVTLLNSLVGSTASDQVGSTGITELTNGSALVRSKSWDNGVVVDAGRVDIISEAPAFINPHTFATDPTGTSTLGANNITALLNAGTAVTLQANNDITVINDLISNNPGGDGGELTLQAGRSILVNANITTDNGNLTIIANETTAAGVIDAQRGSGDAVITMAPGTGINAGTGAVNIEIKDGAGKTYTDSGSITLQDITAGTITAVNNGPTVDSGIILSGTLTAAGAGTAITLAGDNFVNNTGSSALSAAGGRWLVWSGDPANDTRNGLVYDFKQYNAAYGSTSVSGGISEDGFLYTLAPTTTSSLTGAVTRAYDADTTATLAAGNYSLSGEVDGDTVTLNNPASGTYDNKNVGTDKTVTATGVAIDQALNGGKTVYGYQMAATTATGNIGTITKKDLNVTGITASDKVYDGTTTAATDVSSAAYTGLVNGDDVSVSATGTFDNKNVGTGKTVTLSSSYAGTDKDNYSIIDQATTTADITAKALAISGITASNKVYDGATTAATDVSAAAYTGLVSGDDVSVSATGTFDNKNVGAGKTVTLASGYAGTDKDNYSITDQATTTANITAKAMTISGITASNKVYDGTTTAATDVSSAAYTGLVNGDDVSVSATGTFDNKNVGTGKTVTLSSSYAGTDKDNYSITDQATTTADITARAMTISGITASDKVYDGSTTAITDVSSAAYTGLVNGDEVSVSATGTFDNKNVGTGKTVTLSSSYAGTDKDNYSITDQVNTTADITARAMTINGITVSNKVYDGTTYAATDVSSAAYTGLVNGDDLSVSTTGTFDNKNVGTGKTVTLSSSYTGTDKDNYFITDQATTTADITTVPLMVTAVNDEKDYSGIAYYGGNGVTYSGFVNSETLSVLDGILAYGGSSQGAITSGEYLITPSGLNSSNYDITFVDGTLTINAMVREPVNLLSSQASINGTQMTNASESGAAAVSAIGPGGGRMLLANYSQSNTVNDFTASSGNRILSSNTFISPVNFHREGSTSTLNMGVNPSSETQVETGILHVFSREGGETTQQGSFIVKESQTSLSLTETTPSGSLNDIGTITGEEIPFTISSTEGTHLNLTVSLTDKGVLIITIPETTGSIDISQTVLAGMMMIKNEQNIELSNLKGLLINRQSKASRKFAYLF